ncbi:predicted protein [Naegleria gruberi]|uniref:Predicted protein n=1 Tax=Naegleria gruberi TaxID=5762 RepID=D2VPC3_NAEGR|nr:uncharacterized protein NAEGRDRAFT_70804 [Naegleria gruberi]EFC41331.1 predicted protein [Naegleria gruberi]|eukprot:XP_002674075.1 predicted protein [Naegleria gruberi strain NEG-M]
MSLLPFSLFHDHTESIDYFHQPFFTDVPKHLVHKFGKIKFILCRESSCYVVSEHDELFVRSSAHHLWERHVLDFKWPNERIVKISASYHACVLLLQSGNRNVRVFACQTNDYGSDYVFGEQRGNVTVNVELVNDESSWNTKVWYRVEDFDSLLKDGEYITNISCAAFTCCFITSHGRLLACGCNQFAEIAQPKQNTSNYNIAKIQECCFDPNNECKKPFFVKTVNGDHNIIALTKDHDIFYCGYTMDYNGQDLPVMRQLGRIPQMEDNEHFIDISATYYEKLYLTSRFLLIYFNLMYCNNCN